MRLGTTRLWQGYPDDAREYLVQARSHAEDVGHPGTLMYVLNFAEMTAIELGDLEKAERFAPVVQQLEERYGGLSLGWFEALHRLLNACIPVVRGDPTGLSRLNDILDGWRSATQNLTYSYGLLTLSRGHAMAGDIDAGRRATGEALGLGRSARSALHRRTAVAGRGRTARARR